VRASITGMATSAIRVMGFASRLLGRALGAAIDETMVLSFGRSGFALHALTFLPGELDAGLAGRRCVVEGANSGLGFATDVGDGCVQVRFRATEPIIAASDLAQELVADA